MSAGRQKVLVTGASGFIGGFLVQRLIEKGYDVFGLERYVTGRYVMGAQRSITTFFADLRDYHAVRGVVRDVQPDKVVHLAALSAVSYSYEHPQDVAEVNFLGTLNLAEACLREVGHLNHFLFAGTSEEYGNNGANPQFEDSPLCPNSPYSVSKVAADRYLMYMREAYHFPATVLRPFNTFGRKDNFHFVVERIIHQALTGNEIRLGDPTPVRDFLYVSDHVNAYLTCLENREKSIGQVFNFCTGKGVTIRELVETITKLTKFKGKVVWDTIPRRPLDIQHLVGDASKAAKVLGWKPSFTLEEGLRKTVGDLRKLVQNQRAA